METRKKSLIGMTIGYAAGSAISTFLGLGVFDISSILLGAACALAGIYIAYSYF